jgi:hypothetical protein
MKDLTLFSLIMKDLTLFSYPKCDNERPDPVFILTLFSYPFSISIRYARASASSAGESAQVTNCP